ncbi:MAG: Hpt domain-containing protein, partial [Thioalkalispiraceae bacterium]
NLADSISSIEYYLESLAGNWGQPEAILDVAEQSLAQLNSQPAPGVEQQQQQPETENKVAAEDEVDDTVVDLEVPDLSGASSDTLPDLSMLDIDEPSLEMSAESITEDDTLTNLSLDELSEPSIQIDEGGEEEVIEAMDADAGLMFDGFDEAPEEIEIADEQQAAASSDEISEISLDEQVIEDASEEIEIADESSIATSSDDLANVSIDNPVTDEASHHEIQAEPIATPAETVVAQEHEVSDEIDDEIIEIFLEEAEEEYANIQRLLPQWESNPANEEPLTEMRRSFHTLKGSGRLVGAVDVGEFAWSFENMLNRVIDHTISTSPNLFEVLHRGRDALPVLFDMFKNHTKPGQDVLTLMSYADALSKGEDIVIEEPEKEPVILEPEDSGIESQPAGPVDIDPLLLDIYRKEAETHITTLKEYIADWKSGTEQTATYGLLRALHTLNGSSRTAGVQSLSELCGAFEDYVKDIEGKPFGETALQLLEQLVEFVTQTISILDVPGAQLADNGSLFNQIVALKEVQTKADDSGVEEDAFTIEVDEPSMESEIELEVIEEPVEATMDEGVAAEQAPSTTEPEAEQQTAAEDLGADYDEELLEIFIEEGEEILDESDHTIHQWMQTPDDAELVEALQRQLHTLKGGARMAGISEIGDLGHDIESMLTAVVDGHLAVTKEMQTLLQRAQDRLVTMLEQVKEHKRPQAATDLITEVNKIISGPTVEEIQEFEESADDISAIIDISNEEADIQIELPEEPETTEPVTEQVAETAEPESPADNVVSLEKTAELPVEQETTQPAEEADDAARDRRQGSRIQHEQIRVRSDLLDNLVNFAGEVSIYRSRMEQQTNTFRFNLQELDETIDRFREQLRQFEIEAEAQIQYRKEDTLAQGYEDFDPLEMDRFTQMQHLSRGMLESLGDLDSLRNILSNITRESETLLVQQSRVTTELQEGLMRTRMVQVSGQAPRLRRIVRQVSDELGKPVEFHMQGMDNELDRTILDRVIPPVEHMLRNAVAHGIEKPAQRKQAGKSETGNINISFDREGGEFVIRISDDGMGINLDAIRRKAVEKGMLSADAQPSKEALLELMMQSGFSTAEEVTQIAGRGVGMDVVNTEIKQLGGHLDISTLEGKGTVFTISMPLTLAVSRALMVTAGDETYAIPLLSVEGVERVSYEQLTQMAESDEPVYQWVGNDYKYMHLSSIMGMHQPITYDENRSVPILLVRSGGYRAAIQVDRLIGSREIVVKPVGPQLSTLRGVSGATIMGDGSVVLIIDPVILLRLAATEKDIQLATEISTEAAIEEQSIPQVMVVDDSITVRKVTTRFLERNDMAVSTAKDGVDALGQLQVEENKPDVILLDVEMPRMDGFELATNIRNDERIKDIPIIMITSRTGAKHRDRAMNIGVNVYLGKPYNESELLEHIHNLTGK